MKGKSGSVRMKSLDASGLAAMGRHENRLDYAGSKRAIRDVPPLVYSPYGEGLNLEQSYAAHVEGTKRNKGGRALARHGFLQFPTDLPITPENEQRMLDEAVAFINATHGGRAVFRARLDRDEAGRHGVDVFFAPKYEKTTRRGKVVEDWISLSKFGKELALERFGERHKKEKKPDSGFFEPVFDKTGKPVMERCDSPVFQGRALQDLWTEHLRDRMGLEWVKRGKAKVGRDPDRLEPEEYKIAQERGKLESAKADLVREMEAREAALAARTRELHQREQSLAEREQKAQAVRAGSNQFAAAFRGGEVRKVGPSPKAPDRLTWWASRDVTEARREELRTAWRLTARPVQEALAEVSSATLAVEARKQALQEPEAILQAAKTEAIAGLRDDFDTLKKAWAQNEATYNVSTKGNWRWWLADGLTASRRTRLEACVQSVGGLVGWMARRFEETMNEVVRYLSPSAQAEFRSEWVDALDRDAAPQWDAPGDGPSGVTGGGGHSGPSLGM